MNIRGKNRKKVCFFFFEKMLEGGCGEGEEMFVFEGVKEREIERKRQDLSCILTFNCVCFLFLDIFIQYIYLFFCLLF